MQESITIRNLGPLSNVEIAHLKKFTILIGESGSGKSTLMKCVSLFRYLFKMENIRSYLFHSKISKTPFRINILKSLRDSGLDEFLREDTYIKYTVTFDNGESIELIFDAKQKLKYKTPRRISSSNLQFTKISFITENRNIIPLWASRGAALAGAYLGFYFHEVYKDFELASDALKTIDLDHVGLKLVVKKTHKGKEYKILSKSSEVQFEIEFKNSSSGTQSSTPISLISKYFSQHFDFEDAFNRSVLSYLSKTDSITDFRPIRNLRDLNKRVFIHIEEPELSLYPDAQFKLLEDLVSNCFINSNVETSLFISTHSPYIVNQLNLLIKAFDTKQDVARLDYDDLSVYQVEMGGLQDLMVIDTRLVDTNPLSETINRIYDRYNELGS